MDFAKLKNRAQEVALKVAKSEQAVTARHLAAAQITASARA